MKIENNEIYNRIGYEMVETNSIYTFKNDICCDNWLDMIEINENDELDSIDFIIYGKVFISIPIYLLNKKVEDGFKKIYLNWNNFFSSRFIMNKRFIGDYFQMRINSKTTFKVSIYIGYSFLQNIENYNQIRKFFFKYKTFNEYKIENSCISIVEDKIPIHGFIIIISDQLESILEENINFLEYELLCKRGDDYIYSVNRNNKDWSTWNKKSKKNQTINLIINTKNGKNNGKVIIVRENFLDFH